MTSNEGSLPKNTGTAKKNGVYRLVKYFRQMDWIRKNMMDFVMVVLSMNPTSGESSYFEVGDLITSMIPPPIKMFINEVIISPVFTIKVVHNVSDIYGCFRMTKIMTTLTLEEMED